MIWIWLNEFSYKVFLFIMCCKLIFMYFFFCRNLLKYEDEEKGSNIYCLMDIRELIIVMVRFDYLRIFVISGIFNIILRFLINKILVKK